MKSRNPKSKPKSNFVIKRASATSAFNRRVRKKTRNIVRSNPTVKRPIKKSIQPKRKVSKIPIPSGSGKFTRAVNVGGGNMQDAVFTFSNGTVTDTRFLGEPVRQSKRFKEKRMR